MSKVYTSKQIAEIIGGKLVGKEDIKITYLAPPNLATEDTIGVAYLEFSVG